MWLFLIIAGLLSIIVGIYGYEKGWFRGMNPPLVKKVSIFGGVSLIFLGILLTTFVFVPTKHTGHMIKKYGKQLDSERVIAINGERGRQSDLLQEGLNIIPFVRVLYDIEMVSYEIIPEGSCGLLTAVDGAPLGKDLFTAPDWVTTENEYMRDSTQNQ